jgi:hypothetical protein
MKILFLLITCILLLVSCGKKADPQFQSNIKKEIIIKL